MCRVGLRIAAIVVSCSMMLPIAFAQTYNVLTSFTGPNGGTPYGPLVQGFDGRLYGTTDYDGGPEKAGTVFRITTTGQLTTLNDFCNSLPCDANGPVVGVVQGRDGYFYGGTSGNASIFKMSSAGKLAVLHTFASGTDYPGVNGLIESADSNFYGLTQTGQLKGSAYKITPSGVFTTLANLNGWPNGFTQSPQGDFYISLYYGGAQGVGAIQKMTSEGTVTTLYDFCPQNGCLDGQYPGASVVVGIDGNIYGTTSEGGPHSGGTVFRLTSTGNLTTLYAFCSETNCADGSYPLGLVQGSDGNFYGVTYYGGLGSTGWITSGAGTLFKITPTVTFNGTPANFTIKGDTYLTATVPSGATSGRVKVTTSSGSLTSNKIFYVQP